MNKIKHEREKRRDKKGARETNGDDKEGGWKVS
jgi:hypothetical protein